MLNEPKAPDVNAELSDEQLEQAAGGAAYTVTVSDDDCPRYMNKKVLDAMNIYRCMTFTSIEEVRAYIQKLSNLGVTYTLTISK